MAVRGWRVLFNEYIHDLLDDERAYVGELAKLLKNFVTDSESLVSELMRMVKSFVRK